MIRRVFIAPLPHCLIASFLVAALLVSMSAQQPPRDAPVAAQIAGGSISGVVVSDDADARPVRRAMVSLNAVDTTRGTSGPGQVVTDDNGRFAFSSLPPGRYSLAAEKPAYVRSAYGARRPGRPGTQIQIASGQQFPVTLRIARGAVVTGVVADPQGEPMSSARVGLMMYTYSPQNGERTLQQTGFSATSDDKGTYRIYGITPGDYIVRLTPPFALPGDLRQTNSQSLQSAMQQLRTPASAPGTPASAPAAVQAPSVVYVPVFYPGTTSAANAGVLKLAAGEERAGVDLQLQLVPSAKVEGVVTGPDGLPATSAQVSILSAGPADNLSMTGMMTSVFGGGRPDAEGKFTLSGIAPGHHTVAARTGPAGRGARMGGAGAALWATAEIDVNGQDITGLRLALEPGTHLTGHAVFQGTAPPPQDLTTVRVILTPVLSGSSVAAVIPPVPLDAQGSFSLVGVTPGRYRLSSNAATPWALKSVTVRGQETLDTGVQVRPNEPIGDAVLTFADRATTLLGTLQDATGRPASDYFIIVYASDKGFWAPPSRRVAMTRPASDGQFTVRNLPPGDYLVAAVTDVEQGEWMDPSFLEQLLGASIRVSLAEGESRTQDIRIAGR